MKYLNAILQGSRLGKTSHGCLVGMYGLLSCLPPSQVNSNVNKGSSGWNFLSFQKHLNEDNSWDIGISQNNYSKPVASDDLVRTELTNFLGSSAQSGWGLPWLAELPGDPMG